MGYGSRVFFGYLTHLILDELSSVNLSGAKSNVLFGSAFKLFSLRHLYTSFDFAGVTTYLCVSLPQPERLLHALLDAPSKERLIGTLEWMQAANHRFWRGLRSRWPTSRAQCLWDRASLGSFSNALPLQQSALHFPVPTYVYGYPFSDKAAVGLLSDLVGGHVSQLSIKLVKNLVVGLMYKFGCNVIE